MQNDTSSPSDLSDAKLYVDTEYYDVEIEQGIYNMVVTLVTSKALVMPMPQAKLQVATFLDRLADGLRETLNNQEKKNTEKD